MVRVRRQCSLLLALLACSMLLAPASWAAKPYSGMPPYNPEAVCPPGATTLCVPLDGTFTQVVFDGAGGGSGPANPSDPCQRNDDDNSTLKPLNFTFNFYGTAYTQFSVNTDGNINFSGNYPGYTSNGFPVI